MAWRGFGNEAEDVAKELGFGGAADPAANEFLLLGTVSGVAFVAIASGASCSKRVGRWELARGLCTLITSGEAVEEDPVICALASFVVTAAASTLLPILVRRLGGFPIVVKWKDARVDGDWLSIRRYVAVCEVKICKCAAEI